MDYDIRDELVEKAVAITPGIESPTVAPLHEPGWSAVRSMVPSRETNRIMDELWELGARGILVTTSTRAGCDQASAAGPGRHRATHSNRADLDRGVGHHPGCLRRHGDRHAESECRHPVQLEGPSRHGRYRCDHRGHRAVAHPAAVAGGHPSVRTRAYLGPFREIPWDLIVAVQFPDKLRFARLVLPGEETIALYAVQRFDHERSVAVMRDLRALYEAASTTPSSD